MAIRKIVTVGGPKEGVLHAKAKRISRFDEHLERMVADMYETMKAAPGVGLAAPQIGESIRVLVAEYEDQSVALVNPEIIKVSEEMVLGTEGCLSIPGVVGDNVERHEAVVVKARNPKGKEIRVRADGWFARILQHEIDHLDGILYTDRIKPEDVRPVSEEDIEEAEGVPGEQSRAEGAKAGAASSAATASTAKPSAHPSTKASAKTNDSGKNGTKPAGARTGNTAHTASARGKSRPATPKAAGTAGGAR